MNDAKIEDRKLNFEGFQARPEVSGEQWLGHHASQKQRLWERLNPPHRKQLMILARALVLRQTQARLPEALRAKLLAALDELERVVTRIERLLATVAIRTPPPG